MRILILGGTRFMGPAIARRLVEAEHEVVVFHRGQTEAELPSAVRHIHSPLAGIPLRTLPTDLVALAPEVVLHMNVMGAADAVECMRRFSGVARRLVVASSQDVYRAFARARRDEPGPPDPVPLNEDAPLRDRYYPYRAQPPRGADDPAVWQDDYDKILVERIVLGEPTLPATVLRLPAVYGPGDHQHRVGEYLQRMDAGRPAIVLEQDLADWRWTRGYVENIADAVLRAVEDDRACGHIYNLGEPSARSIEEWVRGIGAAAGWSGEIVLAPRAEMPLDLQSQLDLRQALIFDTARFRHAFDYREAVPWEEALQRTVAWERAHPARDAPAPDFTAEDAVLAKLRSA